MTAARSVLISGAGIAGSYLRDFIEGKQKGAERFAAAFAPTTRFGLFFRNQALNLASIPGLARLMLGRDLVDKLQLPDYRWRRA